MSDSLIAWKPRIDEPSNPMPSSNDPSSTSLMLFELCCQVPNRSMNRKSTIWTPACLAIFKTSAGDFAIAYPFSTTYDQPLVQRIVVGQHASSLTQGSDKVQPARNPGAAGGHARVTLRLGIPRGNLTPAG